MQYNASNVQVKHGYLQLRQQAYSKDDRKAFRPVQVAGIQTRRLDISHGTFRTTMKLKGADGGSCASFFWYHDDRSEIDIEAVTQGSSFVNNTINWTSHPSLDVNGQPIRNATRSVPLTPQYGTDLTRFHEHRFDSDPETGIKYYLDGELSHSNSRRISKEGGNLQIKLWADGNKWWSGIPSTTDVYLTIRSTIAYFNTTATDRTHSSTWSRACAAAGGPGKDTICEAKTSIDRHRQTG